MEDKEKVIKEYLHTEMGRRGKISAQSPLRTKEYYSKLGKKSAEKRRKNKEQKKQSVSSVVSNILTGQI